VLHAYVDLVERGERAVAPLVDGVGVLVRLSNVLGLLERSPVRPEMPLELRERIEVLITERDAARKRRDWRRADEIRAEIESLGALVEDAPSGTHWKWRGA